MLRQARPQARPRTSIVVVVAALFSPWNAHADLDVCRAERSQKDRSAYEVCVARWRGLLQRANEEVRKHPPERLSGCEAEFARWEAAACGDPIDYDAMVVRLAARDRVEWCNGEALLHHATRIDPERVAAASRDPGVGKIQAGAVLLGIFGVGVTAIGGAGIDFAANKQLGDLTGPMMGSMGALSGALAVTGAILLAVGNQESQRHRAQSAGRTTR